MNSIAIKWNPYTNNGKTFPKAELMFPVSPENGKSDYTYHFQPDTGSPKSFIFREALPW